MSEKTGKTLVWLRRDLRLKDNPALLEATRTGGAVEAVYVAAPEAAGRWAPGAASRWYLHHSLITLQRDLASIGIPLYCLQGAARYALPGFARKRGADLVFCNRVVEPQQERQDREVAKTLEDAGMTLKIFPGDTLLPPEQVFKKDGAPYRVFTPFWRRVQALLEVADLSESLTSVPLGLPGRVAVNPQEVERLQLLGSHPWHERLHKYWCPGEANAHQLLESFLQSRVAGYERHRDYPGHAGTSRLSPALHFGEIAIGRVYGICREVLLHEQDELTRKSIHGFLTELGWREFARHALHAFPNTPEQSLNPQFDQPEAWEQDTDGSMLQAWQRGRTGIPLVDAGMRELWETGWMHNRVRMITASFLTKNLGVHWLEGARWFWDTLVDADLASNTLGWQWVAGCGTDAAPYYRIFNPETQAKKFDPDGAYIGRWLGDDAFKAPVVDLKSSRQRALDRYQAVIRR